MKDRYHRVSDPRQSGLTAYRYKDALTLYNFVVRQCNEPCNQVEQAVLAECYCDTFYRFWYNQLRRWYFLVLLLYLAPYFTVVTLCFTLYCVVIHENAVLVSARNRKAIPDPFTAMISHDEICRRGKSHNLYFTVRADNLDVFPFSDSIKGLLRTREQDGVISFMVYDQHFKGQFDGLKAPRVLIWVHFVVNLCLFIGMQLLVYKPYLCFDIFHPLQSVSECGQSAIEATILFMLGWMTASDFSKT